MYLTFVAERQIAREHPIPQQAHVRQSPIRQSPIPQQAYLHQQQPSTSVPCTVPDSWECKHCTFINPNSNKICQVCCKTASPRTETPVSPHSRPNSSAAGNRKGSLGSEKECSSPEKASESEASRKDRQDIASLNSALDEAEKVEKISSILV